MVLLLSACQPTAMDRLQERHGRYYPHYSDTPYSGTVVTYYNEDRNRVYQRGTLVDGFKEGIWTINHWNGEVDEITFKNGVRHGTTYLRYANGRVKQTQDYQNGLLHGQGYLWSADGRMVYHSQHDEGKLVLLSEPKNLPTDDHTPTFAPPIDLLADLFPPHG